MRRKQGGSELGLFAGPTASAASRGELSAETVPGRLIEGSGRLGENKSNN